MLRSLNRPSKLKSQSKSTLRPQHHRKTKLSSTQPQRPLATSRVTPTRKTKLPLFVTNTVSMSTQPTKKVALVPKLPLGDTSKPYANARSIICLVRTYRDHALELNNAIPEDPIVFLKPPSCLIMEKDIGKNQIEVPPTCTNLHHEIELGLIIGKEGRDIPVEQAMDYISGYFLGLDMTAREIQGEAKSKGLPWSISKGYDTFGPISPPIPKNVITDPSKLRLQLQVNGDLIYSGTPAGVGPVVAGDVITCQLTDEVTQDLITEMQFGVIKRPGPAKL